MVGRRGRVWLNSQICFRINGGTGVSQCLECRLLEERPCLCSSKNLDSNELRSDPENTITIAYLEEDTVAAVDSVDDDNVPLTSRGPR